MKRGVILIILAVFMLLSLGTNTRAESDTLHITVSILPQKYFAEQIFEPPIDVTVIIGPGQSPATYAPTPKLLAEISRSDLLFTIGVPFEGGLLEKLRKSFSQLPIISTKRGILLRPIEGHDHNNHGNESHDGETLDPHIWLDPTLVKTIAANMSGADAGRLADFETRLDSLDTYISEKLAPYKGQKLYVFHPSFGYFCDRYGLEQVAIETEGKEPSARQLAKLITQARADKVKAIIIQGQFSKKTAEAIAQEIGAEVITLDPLAYDYINNMKYMADTIADALGRQ